MYLFLNPTLTAEEIYMKLLPNAVELDTQEGGVLLYGKNTGASKKYFWSAITALFPDKVRTSPDGTTDCLYFDSNDMLVYDASSDTLKIVQVNEFNSLTQLALFGHYYGNITGKLVEANARNLQYMVNDFFMQDETATVLTFEFDEEGGLVTLDLTNVEYSSVYFDQYARIPLAGSTTVSFSFTSGRHYVTLINNSALAGIGAFSFITVGKENLIAVKISTLVNDIGANAFSGCTALKKADIPFSANGAQRRIADVAFGGCPLEELKIPEGFTEIGYDCFNSATAKEVELPTTLNALAGLSLSGNIEKIICKATNPVWTTPEEETPFTNALLIVPHDSVETYKSLFGYDNVEAYAYLQDVENLAPKGYRLIRDITLEENVEQLDITTDDSGKSLNLKCVFIRFMGMFTATASVQSFVLRFNGGSWYQMYDFYDVTADRLYAHWIKSERMNTPTTDMWLSAYPFELCKPLSGELVNSQGLADMCRTVHSDIAWFDGGNRSINRIGYGCASVGGANMKAGSRIVIWGIDDDE